MKRIIVATLLGIGSAVVALGQGKVSFSNYFTSGIQPGIVYGNGPVAGWYCGSEVSAILLYGPSTATSISQLTPLASSSVPCGFGALVGPSIVPPSYNDGQGTFSSRQPVAVPGTPGSTYAFAIEAIGTYLGGSFVGYSTIVTGTTQASSAAPIPRLPFALQNQYIYVYASNSPPFTIQPTNQIAILGSNVARRF